MCAPASVQRAYRAFRFLYLFAGILIQEKRFPTLNSCFEDLRSRYSNFPIFDDGIFIESWIFLDFPITPEGRTVLDEFSEFCSHHNEANAEFAPFIETAKKSRLGLYQEILSTSRITKYREFFTDNVISTLRSVPDYSSGEIFLGRIIESGKDRFLLGDPKNWPSQYSDNLTQMVLRRLTGISGSHTTEKYERFMKLSGPYWMSCVCGDADDDILPPDYWKQFHN